MRPTLQGHSRLGQLAASGKGLVGWGTGGVFELCHAYHPLPLRYLVDNRWPATPAVIAGLPVYSPERLREEDPEDTCVIVFSTFWQDVVGQVAALGAFDCVSATRVYASDQRLARIGTVEAMPLTPRRRQGARSDRAILLQGPVDGIWTPRVVAAYRERFRDAWLVLSTWETTDPELLDRLGAWVDDVVLSPLPSPPGVQNRNCQLVSTQRGIERCAGLGARELFKGRTDVIALNPHVFGMRTELASRFGHSDSILVPASFTRKYIPFHPSDLLQLGPIDAMQAFWDQPMDLRSFDMLARVQTTPLSRLADEGICAETYFAKGHRRNLGDTGDPDLADAWRYLRDRFIVVDDDDLQIAWLKHPALLQGMPLPAQQEIVDHAFWRKLQRADVDAMAYRSPIRIHEDTWYGPVSRMHEGQRAS